MGFSAIVSSVVLFLHMFAVTVFRATLHGLQPINLDLFLLILFFACFIGTTQAIATPIAVGLCRFVVAHVGHPQRLGRAIWGGICFAMLGCGMAALIDMTSDVPSPSAFTLWQGMLAFGGWLGLVGVVFGALTDSVE